MYFAIDINSMDLQMDDSIWVKYQFSASSYRQVVQCFWLSIKKNLPYQHSIRISWWNLQRNIRENVIWTSTEHLYTFLYLYLRTHKVLSPKQWRPCNWRYCWQKRPLRQEKPRSKSDHYIFVTINVSPYRFFPQALGSRI